MYIRRYHNGNTIATVATHKHYKKIEIYDTANSCITLILFGNTFIHIINKSQLVNCVKRMRYSYDKTCNVTDKIYMKLQ